MNPKVSLCVPHDEYDWILPLTTARKHPEPHKSGSASILTSQETEWRDIYYFLLDHGFELRSRYRPGWIPSWLGTDLDDWRCEDGIVAIVSHLGTNILRILFTLLKYSTR